MAHKTWTTDRLSETTSSIRTGARLLGIKGVGWLPDGLLQDALQLIVAKIDQKPDVDTTDIPANGEVLTYDSASGKYKPSPSGSAPVTSVFTRTGAVTSASGDYNAGQITNTPAGNIAATTVQAAINELDSEKLSSVSASGVSNTPAGNIAATTVQAALNELDSEKATPSQIPAIASQAQADAGTDDATIMTPLKSANMLRVSPTEVSVTGATTLTSTAFGKMHVCSGTSADYTVGLPAVSGNAGKVIGLRGAPGLTKIVTIDGNASETISGNLSIPLLAYEDVVLLCTGTEWVLLADTRANQAFVLNTALVYSGAPAANTTTTSVDLRGTFGVPIDAKGAWINAYGYCNAATAGTVQFDSADVTPGTYSPTFTVNPSYLISVALPVRFGTGANAGKIKWVNVPAMTAALLNVWIIGWFR